MLWGLIIWGLTIQVKQCFRTDVSSELNAALLQESTISSLETFIKWDIISGCMMISSNPEDINSLIRE